MTLILPHYDIKIDLSTGAVTCSAPGCPLQVPGTLPPVADVIRQAARWIEVDPVELAAHGPCVLAWGSNMLNPRGEPTWLRGWEIQVGALRLSLGCPYGWEIDLQRDPSARLTEFLNGQKPLRISYVTSLRGLINGLSGKPPIG